MATFQIPKRSISLPSRLHPVASTKFDSVVQKLKSLSISFEAIQPAILNLAEMYNFVHELMQYSCVQQSLVGISMEDSILEGSVELIDYCNTIKELFQMIKENVQSLQSVLRRKVTRDSAIHTGITSYFCFRKKMSTSIAKILKKLKIMENMINYSLNSDEYLTRVLRESTEVTFAIFRSILMCLSYPPVNKSGRWDLVTRFMVMKSKASSGDKKIPGVMESLDFALLSFQENLKADSRKVLDEGRIVQKSLKDLDVCVQGIGKGLDTLFRQLIRSRVTILNILTDH